MEFTKKIIPFSLFTPRVFIRKLINVAEPFLRGEGVTHQRERTLRERGLHVERTGRNKGRGSKIGNFERTYFLNASLCLQVLMPSVAVKETFRLLCLQVLMPSIAVKETFRLFQILDAKYESPCCQRLVFQIDI